MIPLWYPAVVIGPRPAEPHYTSARYRYAVPLQFLPAAGPAFTALRKKLPLATGPTRAASTFPLIWLIGLAALGCKG